MLCCSLWRSDDTWYTQTWYTHRDTQYLCVSESTYLSIQVLFSDWRPLPGNHCWCWVFGYAIVIPQKHTKTISCFSHQMTIYHWIFGCTKRTNPTLQLIWFNVITFLGKAQQLLCQDMDWKPSGPWGLLCQDGWLEPALRNNPTLRSLKCFLFAWYSRQSALFDLGRICVKGFAMYKCVTSMHYAMIGIVMLFSPSRHSCHTSRCLVQEKLDICKQTVGGGASIKWTDDYDDGIRTVSVNKFLDRMKI